MIKKYYFKVILILGLFLLLSGCDTSEELKDDLTGVWSNEKTGIVEVNLTAKNPYLKLVDGTIEATIKDIDTDNGIVTINSKEWGIWTLRKDVNEDSTFNLLIINQDGKEFYFGFVRNL